MHSNKKRMAAKVPKIYLTKREANAISLELATLSNELGGFQTPLSPERLQALLNRLDELSTAVRKPYKAHQVVSSDCNSEFL